MLLKHMWSKLPMLGAAAPPMFVVISGRVWSLPPIALFEDGELTSLSILQLSEEAKGSRNR